VAVKLGLVSYAAAAWAALPTSAGAQNNEAHLRVVDVGAGLCLVATAPGGHSMVYDAGKDVPTCLSAVREIVPGDTIDLLVLSHSDADHIGAAKAILEAYKVKTIIHPGDDRENDLSALRTAIAAESGANIWNLATRPLEFGRQFSLGDAKVSFVAGWSDGNATRAHGEKNLTDAMRKNALSSVIRFEFGGHSVLLTGDTVGRFEYEPASKCEFAERIMVDNATTIPIRSDVLIGQHHGADNATANCFIRAVKPRFVIFSAGNLYGHPRQSTANRLVANGILPDNIYRTDRAGYEKPKSAKSAQWIYKTYADCIDAKGDDDVEIHLPANPVAPVSVNYRVAKDRCEP
jgi:beta-lactamase superfamily II metal-dependent hydrolase